MLAALDPFATDDRDTTMLRRLLFGLLLAAGLSACSSSDNSTGSAGNDPAAGAPNSLGSTARSIILQGAPSGSAAIDGNYFFHPIVVSTSGPVTFAIEGRPKWASFDDSTGTLSGTPLTTDEGLTDDITITASNGQEIASVGPFVIRVTLAPAGGADTLPVISGTPVGSAIAGQTYTFQPSASDAAGAPLTYAITNRPVWTSFSTSTGRLSGTPTAAQVGTYSNIQIYVTDGSTNVALPDFTIAVTAATPDMPLIGGTPASSTMAGQSYSFQPTATDPAAKPLRFSILRAPSWSTFDTTTGRLAGTPTATQEGNYSNIVITASNGISSASLPPFVIAVSAPSAPDAPVIEGSPPTSGTAGQRYSFQPNASDPTGAALIFSIVNRPRWAAFDSANGRLEGTPSSADSGRYPGIRITASSATASATLPAFDLVIHVVTSVTPSVDRTATLDWTAPKENTNGTPLTDLAGYRIYYGTSATAMTRTVQISDPRILSYVFSNLSPATWYFEAKAYTSMNIESSASAMVSKVVD